MKIPQTDGSGAPEPEGATWSLGKRTMHAQARHLRVTSFSFGLGLGNDSADVAPHFGHRNSEVEGLGDIGNRVLPSARRSRAHGGPSVDRQVPPETTNRGLETNTLRATQVIRAAIDGAAEGRRATLA